MSQQLQLDPGERARACHRIVRAMHDGECPKCHHLWSSETMRVAYGLAHPDEGPNGHRCANCHFEISITETSVVLAEFGDYMTKSLAIFEQWREERKATPAKAG